MSEKEELIEVAVGVILKKDANGDEVVLIAKRAEKLHQGGKWEFPGGKREAGESIQQALSRELREELDISIRAYEPLIKIRHHYPEKTVLLNVWKIHSFEGIPRGCEGQPLQWRPLSALNAGDFPPANAAIITALQLPDRYLITPDFGGQSETEFFERLTAALNRGVKLVQLRSHSLCREDYFALAAKVSEVCRQYKARCLLNIALACCDEAIFSHAAVAGVHLTGQRLHELERKLTIRPESFKGWLSASCHTKDDVMLANRLKLDFISISPIKPTASHPSQGHIGWEAFTECTELALMPVYALGGMQVSDIRTAQAAGGQGVAAMSALWG